MPRKTVIPSPICGSPGQLHFSAKKVIGNQTGEDNQTGPTTSIGDAVERKPASGERPTVPSLRHMR